MQNKKTKKIIVYIAAPYTLPSICNNVRIAISVANELMNEGYMPFCPHLFHFQNISHTRPEREWLEIDKEWLKVCDVVLRLKGKSKGADAEVALAKKLGIPVVRTIEQLGKYKKNTGLKVGKNKINTMENNLFKRVVARFLRGFASGAIASMVAFGGAMTLSATDWSDIINWLVLLAMAGIVGGINAGILAVDLYLRNKDKEV